MLRKLAGRLLLHAMKKHLLCKKLNSTESQLLSVHWVRVLARVRVRVAIRAMC